MRARYAITSAALLKYLEMRSFVQGTRQVITFALDGGYIKSSKEAEKGLDALFQWMAYHTTKEDTSPTVMLSGSADTMLKILLRDPSYYVNFCQRYAGYIIRRIPTCSVQSTEIRDFGGILHTVQGLEEAFGTELASELMNWRERRWCGCTVTAISPVGDVAEEEQDTFIGENLKRLWAT